MPISDCEVLDPRIRRTRQLLQGALRNLMQTQSLDEISVQDITGSATLNRATFYDHYTDKFALFQAMVATEFHALLAERGVTFDGACPSALSTVMLAVCHYLTQTHSRAATGDRQNPFEPLFEAAITMSIQHLVLPGMLKHSGRSRSKASEIATPQILTPEIIASTISWAIYGAVKEWFHTRDRAPAEEMVGQMLPLIVPLIRAA